MNETLLKKKRPLENGSAKKVINNVKPTTTTINKNNSVKSIPNQNQINKKLKVDSKKKVEEVEEEIEEEDEDEVEIDEQVESEEEEEVNEEENEEEEEDEDEEEDEEEEYVEDKEIEYNHGDSESENEEDEEQTNGDNRVHSIKDLEYKIKDTKENKQTDKPANGSAWVDDDDEEDEDEKIKRIMSSNILPSWAKKNEETKEDEDNEDKDEVDILLENNVFNSDKRITYKGDGYLNTKITVKRGIAQYVSKIDYSETSNLIIMTHTAGVTLFSTYNLDKPLHSSILKGFGCSSAAQLPNTNECIVIGHKPHYFIYNTKTVSLKKYSLRVGDNELRLLAVSNDYYAICDSLGKTSILSNKSKTLVKEIQLPSKAVSLMKFSPHGDMLFIVAEGWITVYDCKLWRVTHRFKDQGNAASKSILSIAFSPNQLYFVTGSESGMVNIYELAQCLLSESPKPLETLTSMVNPVTALTFNSTSSLLVMSSSTDKGIVRIISVPNFKAVHWCDAKKVGNQFNSITSSVFSNDGKALYLTNDKGAIIKVRGFK